jgi:tetratricopeptide (TPR) repeat protein
MAQGFACAVFLACRDVILLLMTRSALAIFQIARIAPGSLALLGLLAALAGCTTLGNPPASNAGAGEGLLATSQANLTSLGEVITNHPDDPQAYNMRGTVYGEAGRDDQALADFNKAISLDPN